MADNFSLFGASPEQTAEALNKQQQLEAMQAASQMGPQGNPYYVPGIGASNRMAGGNLASSLAGLFGAQPEAIKRAYTMQEVQKATDAHGIDIGEDPVGYMKIAASEMLKKGLRQEALQAIQQAQKMQSEQADVSYKESLGSQAEATAYKTRELVEADKMLRMAQADLATNKAEVAKAESEIKWLEERRASVKDEKEAQLIDAKIYNLRRVADAAKIKADKAGTVASSNMTVQKVLGAIVNKESQGIPLTPAEKQVRQTWGAAVINPMQSAMFGMMGMGGETPSANPQFNPPEPISSGPVPVEKPYPAVPGQGPYAPQPNYDWAKAATKAFGKYEPNKYEYRINPDTGKIQRKAK